MIVLQTAALVWFAIATLWLVLASREPRGRLWHVTLALAPLPAFAFALWGPADLAPVARLWLVMGAAILMVVSVGWLLGAVARNHGMMDIVYPLTVLAASCLAAWLTRVDAWTVALMAPMAVWALRLAVQTYGHNVGSEREPYASWRCRFDRKWVWWSFFQIHLLQGVTVWIWCLPIAAALSAPEPRPVWPAMLGLAVWAAGFLLQSIADTQLAAFKRDPANRGKLLDRGVWSFVRHPNYLGEALIWWGYFCFALAHPWGWATVVSPLFATWFMGYGSAVPFKERHMAKTRSDAWAAYSRRTPRFLPWPRRA